ncbi:hypothetical protein CDL15_Pgr026204 [Punica granatum]|uniref:Uncharacterized protein n=1 Tax=Punica granatum TaxID=22663 RepID=A0A218VSG4_PUNGR|nr:hypothetical protein CDL15_Pgr026204 [Punica granatum]
MFYQASGCEERVGEGFESRVTRWNPQKDVRVQGHARSDELGMRLGLHGRADAQAGARAEAWGTGERTGSRGAQANEEEYEPSILMKKKPNALMSIDEGLSVVLKDLDIFLCKCAREAWGGRFGKGGVALGQFMGPTAEEEKPGESLGLD